jgi:DNA-binding MarR family transcriptional regulator
MSATDRWFTAIATLKLSSRLIDQIQSGVKDAGFDDVTPLHGFAFVRIAAGGATTADLAAHLAVSKQAAAQLIQRLVQAGYVERRPHPHDHRARILQLTARGHLCTQAARLAAERAVDQWRTEIPARDAPCFEATLLALTASVPGIRPPL